MLDAYKPVDFYYASLLVLTCRIADATEGELLQVGHAQKPSGIWVSFAQRLCMPPLQASQSTNSSPSLLLHFVQYTVSSAVYIVINIATGRQEADKQNHTEWASTMKVERLRRVAKVCLATDDSAEPRRAVPYLAAVLACGRMQG